jgi:thymidylate synthase
MTMNRHPVDALADVRQKIKMLQEREWQLRDMILRGQCQAVGDEYEAEVVMQRRETLDTKAVKWKFSREELAQFMKTTEVAIVKLSRLGNGDSHEWMD